MSLELPFELVEKLKTHLREFVSECDEAYAALLSTTDGHAVAMMTHQPLSESRIAAITSSAIGLGEALAREAGQAECQFVISQNSDGFVVIKRVGKIFAFSAMAGRKINLGMLLASINRTHEDLLNELNDAKVY